MDHNTNQSNRRTQVTAVVLLIYVAFVGLGFYYLFVDWFSVSPQLAGNLIWVSLVSSTLLTLFLHKVQPKSKIRGSQYSSVGPIKIPSKQQRARLWDALLLLVGAIMFTWLAVTFGITGLLHQFSSTPIEREYQVSDTVDRRRNRRCIQLEEKSYFNGNFCRLEHELWTQIEEGDTVVAIGSESPFGLSITEFQLRE